MQSILQTGFSESALSSQVIANIAIGALFLGLGWFFFETCTRNEKPATEERGLLSRRRGAGNSIVGAGRAWHWALGWKDFHFVAGGKMLMLVKFTAYFGIMGLIVWTERKYGGGRMRVEDFGTMALSIGTCALVIELAIQGSRVFHTELKWKTWSSVVLLPKSIGEIAYSKLFGTLIGLLPALLVIFVGAVCAPDGFFDAVQDMLEKPGGWYGISQLILLIHLSTLLSLYVKWGAMPLAFASVYGGNILMMFFFSMMFRFGPPGDEMWVLFSLVTIVACIVMHPIIGNRLRHLAAR